MVSLGGPRKTAEKLKIEDFPSGKVAGEPLWLIPDTKTPICCEKPSTFLLQVYAPIGDFDHSYHRYLYCFICPDWGRVNIIKQQLPEINEHYGNQDPPEAAEDTKSSEEQKAAAAEPTQSDLLAMLTAAKEETKPAKRKKKRNRKFVDTELNIFDEDPQVTHFVEQLVLLPIAEDTIADINSYMYADLEESAIPVVETTEMEGSEEDDPELEDFVQDMSAHTQDVSFDLLKFSSTQDTQCVRYARRGLPMWYSDKGRPEVDPGVCPGCSAPRIFEFQVMPQVIYYTNNTDIDFGTLLVFTCSESCEYTEEFSITQSS